MKRLNVTDRFLILLFALCLVAVGARVWSLRGDAGRGLEPLEILVEWRDVDTRTVACLSAGELLYTAAGEAYGRVERIEYLPVEETLLQNGDLLRYEVPMEERCNARLTLSLEGRVDGGILLRNGTESVAVGERKTLYSERCEITVFILLCGVKA